MSHYSFCAPQAPDPHWPYFPTLTMRIACLRALCVSAALLISAECAAGLPETKVSSPDAAGPEKGPPRRLRVAEDADKNNGDERMFRANAADEAVANLAREVGGIGESKRSLWPFLPTHDVFPSQPSTTFESTFARLSLEKKIPARKEDVSEHALPTTTLMTEEIAPLLNPADVQKAWKGFMKSLHDQIGKTTMKKSGVPKKLRSQK